MSTEGERNKIAEKKFPVCVLRLVLNRRSHPVLNLCPLTEGDCLLPTGVPSLEVCPSLPSDCTWPKALPGGKPNLEPELSFLASSVSPFSCYCFLPRHHVLLHRGENSLLVPPDVHIAKFCGPEERLRPFACAVLLSGLSQGVQTSVSWGRSTYRP